MNNWDDVRFFLEVARQGNLTAAARELGVNHSTVARRIKALEDRQGVRLFEQLSSGYKLTDDAYEVYELALDIEALNYRFSRKLQGLDSRLQGRVALTMPHDIFEFFLAEHLAQFQEQHPEIVLDLLVAKGLKNLSHREADIALRLTDTPPEYLVGKQLCELHYGLYQSSKFQNPESHTPIITWSDQAQVPSWAVEHLPAPSIRLHVNDLLAMYKAVEAGLGIARMPVYMHNCYRSPKVQQLPTKLPKSKWGVWLLSHADLRKTARVQALKQFLQSTLEQHLALFTA
ncbi:MAG: LysR family transcriptional regulator [Cellvibrionaceae bacterium]|nr:LysR family transcriptional regulator [Cellvibrionaceae bacterium]